MGRGRRRTRCRLHRESLRCPWCRSHRAANGIRVMMVDLGAKLDAARAHAPHLPSSLSPTRKIDLFPFPPILGSYRPLLPPTHSDMHITPLNLTIHDRGTGVYCSS